MPVIQIPVSSNSNATVLVHARMLVYQNKLYHSPTRYSKDEARHRNIHLPVSVGEFSDMHWTRVKFVNVLSGFLIICFDCVGGVTSLGIWMYHTHAYQHWIASTQVPIIHSAFRHAMWQHQCEMRAALAMALHPRLGGDSALHVLHSDQIETIGRLCALVEK
jgi:hypothetical protein